MSSKAAHEIIFSQPDADNMIILAVNHEILESFFDFFVHHRRFREKVHHNSKVEIMLPNHVLVKMKVALLAHCIVDKRLSITPKFGIAKN